MEINKETSQQGFPPKNWLIESVLVTIFCCLPLGIVGIIFASGVEGKFLRGDIQGAQNSAQMAKIMVMVSVIAAVIIVAAYILFFGGLAFLGATAEN